VGHSEGDLRNIKYTYKQCVLVHSQVIGYISMSLLEQKNNTCIALG